MSEQLHRRPIESQETTKPEGEDVIKTDEVTDSAESTETQPNSVSDNNQTPIDEKTEEDWEADIREAKLRAEAEKAQSTSSELERLEKSRQMMMEAAGDGTKETPTGKLPEEQPDSTKTDTGRVYTQEELEAEVQRRLDAERNASPPKVEATISTTAPISSKTDAEKEAIAKENNISSILMINLGDTNDFELAITRELEDDPRSEEERTNNPTEYARGMAMVRNYGMRTLCQQDFAEWIKHFKETNPDVLKTPEDKLRITKIMPKIGSGKGAKEVSGSAAMAVVASRIKGLYRIQLFNSGFWIDICPPSLAQIDMWMQEVDQEFKDIGRYLGGKSYSVLDIFLKQKLCDILPELIFRSNYSGWRDKEKLLNNISYHDYETILWGICCTMYRDGIGIGVYCTNPECRHADTSQYVDITKMCYLNTAVFPPEALAWMVEHAHNTVTALTDQDLEDYRTNKLKFRRKAVTTEAKKISYVLDVPSIAEVVKWGSELVGKIAANTNGEKNINTDIISNQLTFHLFKMFTPWMYSLTVISDDGEEVETTKDHNAIYASLDTERFDNTDLYDEIVNFIRDTKLTYYSATTLHCPVCGKTAELDKDNMVPTDMQDIFFGLCCLRLTQNGIRF